MRKLLFVFSVVFFRMTVLWAQQPDEEGSLVKWMTWNEAFEKMQKNPRPILMDFYTDWCGWCKVMMKSTYANPGLAQYINTYFYPVKFNAEGKDTIEYLGKKYGPTSPEPRTPHQLSVHLLQGKLMYPTTLFLNGYDKEKNEFRLNMLANGYLDQQKIEPILVYVVENVYRNASMDDFRDQYQKAFYDSVFSKRIDSVKWELPKSAFGSELPRKKKTLVYINTDWCNACKVMKRTSFNDSLYEEYLQTKFNVVNFNADMTDTLIYKGRPLGNAMTSQAPFHQLALVLSRNGFALPTLVVLDEYMDVLDAVPGYIPPVFMNDILHYYGEGINKSKTWQVYIAEKEQK
ncbi:MAG TPA: DUF255 domain-containing protein [Bacteroidia bacterium]|nr:DUF255 domain-containing protein [Bacteroidia bacterium]